MGGAVYVMDEVPSGGTGGGEIRDLTEAEAAAEFATLADNIPTLRWMAQADGHIYWYNRRWYDYTGTSIDTQKGWGWESVHDPAVLPAVVERWQRSLATGQPFEMTFPLRGADGVFRPFLTRVVPIRDENGEIVRWFGTNTDVEALEQAEAELRLRTGELETLLVSAPIGFAYFDRQHRYLRVNDELARVNGIPVADHIGKSVEQLLPVNAAAVTPIIDQVFATGEPVSEIEVTGDTPLEPGVERHWLTGFFPVRGVDGSVQSVGVWVIEISERKAAEQRERLLAREVDHRAKNLLAVVQSIVQLTPTDDIAFKASVVGRIQALAHAHSLLAEARWNGVELSALVDEEMAPFAGRGSAVVASSGPRVVLRPAAAQSIALVLHELATNAAKYGALSAEDGRLTVEWDRQEEESGPMLAIRWTESGGPAVAEPTVLGFGSSIVRASIERQLRGRLDKQWRPGGLLCTLSIPWTQVVGPPDA